MKTLLTLRRLFSGLALLPLLCLSAGAAEKPAAPRPNIVFILMDDLRWNALGCMGHPVAKTPNIDRLAHEGALFKNFFVSIPLCSPSRASFLTGQYAHTHGILDNTDRSAASHKLVTFPKLLRDSGYETAYVGKWHMGNDDSPRPGFDRWVSFKGQGVFENPVLNIDGKAKPTTGYMTDLLNQHAVDFIKAPHEKPFLLYLAHKAVHGPATPAERHKNLYAGAKFSSQPNVNSDLANKPALTFLRTNNVAAAPARRANKRNPNAQARRQVPPAGAHEKTILNQLRTLAAVDDGVGDILKALTESGQLDRTLVIFTSDNGYFWGEHTLGDKRWAYEESIRDPLLMRYPPLIKAGTQLDQMVMNIDIAPTLLDLAKAPVPSTMQGQSFLPLLQGKKPHWRTSFLTEYFEEMMYARTPTWSAVHGERWKYIHYPKLTGMDELYDLKNDPYEMKNVIGEKSAAKPLRQMQAELKAQLVATGGE